jgi:anti-anti-sigma factor
MELEIRTRERDGVTIVDVTGRMSLPYIKLRSVVTRSIETGTKRLVLNLENATYIDSMWLGAIVSDFTKLRQLGGQLKLMNPPPQIMQLLAITKLSLAFDIFTSEDDAVNSFYPDRVLLYPRALAQDAIPSAPPTASPSPLVVFLCHSSNDKPVVRTLYQHLKAKGIDVWLDEVSLLPGQLWEKEIPAAVHRSDAVLVCLSRASVTRTGYVQREIKYALDAAEQQSDESIFLIPARLEDCEVPERLRKWHWVDLFTGDGFDRLITALQARALALQKRPVHQ